MQFNSYEFIFAFLPATVAGFWLLVRLAGPAAARGWLIAASIAFYAYGSLQTLAAITPLILLNFFAAAVILRTPLSSERMRLRVFSSAVTVNVLFLGYFKYKNFFLDTANAAFATHFEAVRVMLPLGISFLTFQMIAFLADVNSGQVKSIRIVDYLVFALFFPRTIAGPIIHYGEVAPQLTDVKTRSYASDIAVGVCLFSIGLFKKAVVADGVAQFVPRAFDAPTWNTFLSGRPPTLLIAWGSVLAYAFQLYFDFSGYSDMALGAARMVGVRLPMNFNSPYKAHSIVEFWGRWHITLTRFLTTYIYTPLAMSLTRARSSKGKAVLHGKRSSLHAIWSLVAVPTLITMTISGLWHGAGWQFIVWGVLHGIYLTINQTWRLLHTRFWPGLAANQRVMQPLGFVLTFGAVVIALVFFRASSIGSALSIIAGMIGLNGILPHDVQLLRGVGAGFDWMNLSQLIEPFKWIIVLLLATTWLPNSLELLRRFQPALDFPQEQWEVPRQSTQQQASLEGATEVRGKLRAAAARIRQLCNEGIALSRVTAIVVAVLCVLGIMALGHGGAFLYWQF
jgi:alginate O-acetyltransferase complex protein AlgI